MAGNPPENRAGNRPQVQNFQTVHPEGKNSNYTRLPDNRWVREKVADNNSLHVQDRTVFVHPNYGEQAYPHLTGQTYNPLELAARQGTLVHPGGRVGVNIVNPNKIGDHSPRLVPEEHISSEPREGWHPVEFSLHPETGAVTKYHLGHPVAPFNPSNFRA